MGDIQDKAIELFATIVESNEGVMGDIIANDDMSITVSATVFELDIWANGIGMFGELLGYLSDIEISSTDDDNIEVTITIKGE